MTESSTTSNAEPTGIANRLQLYLAMFRHWGGMLSGRGYWHAPQGLGCQFVPGKLAGYYNDLTGKTRWNGATDDNGLILNQRADGTVVRYPTAIFQQALGHWDLWLASGRTSPAHRDVFLAGARWALEHQDQAGGWSVWSLLGTHDRSEYSSMTQGEGASLLVRAFEVSRDERFLDAARRALALMLLPVDRGGVAREVPGGLVLEEVANRRENAVLNGWVFSLFGLYDYLLVRRDDEAAAALDRTLSALCLWLPRYYGSYWSLYDTQGALASPFYHHLHIAQLSALEMAFPERAPQFAHARQRFERQAASRLWTLRAVFAKAAQKLRQPPPGILR